MREKLNTLPLSELRELAKSQGLRGISGLRKAELVELLCRMDEEGKMDQEKSQNQEEDRKA